MTQRGKTGDVRTFRARLLGRVGDDAVSVTLFGRGRMTVTRRTLRWEPLLLDRILGRRRKNGPIEIDELLHIGLMEHPRFKRHLLLSPNLAARRGNAVFLCRRQLVHDWLDANGWTVEYAPDDFPEREAIAVPPGRRVRMDPSDADGPFSEPVGWSGRP